MVTETTTEGFDFSTVTVAEKELPPDGRGRPNRPNPFKDVLRESYAASQTEDGKPGRSVTLPAKAVPEAYALIRRAADDLGCGARIVIQRANGDRLEVKEVKEGVKAGKLRGNLTLMFAGKKRKSPPQTNTETPTEDAEDAEDVEDAEGSEDATEADTAEGDES